MKYEVTQITTIVVDASTQDAAYIEFLDSMQKKDKIIHSKIIAKPMD